MAFESDPIHPEKHSLWRRRRAGRSRRRCSAWGAEVGSRIGELRGRAKAVEGGREKGSGAFHGRRSVNATNSAVLIAVERSLDCAEDAIQSRRGRRRPWLSLCGWWSGSAITTAWEAVHTAELALLSVESDEEVAVSIPRLLSWVERTMDKGKQREEHETALRRAMEKFSAGDRGKVRAALADVIEANGNRYANVRAFRNNLILVTFALLAAVVGVAVWHAVNPHFISLCTEAAAGKPTYCLGGKEAKPDGADVAMVAAMGALGGLLAIAFSFSENDVAPSRYDPKTWQAFLKPVTGAAVAIIAVLFLQSGFLLKPSNETQSMFLAYAVLFGFSQQLLTRFVDKQADSLIMPDGAKKT